MASVHNAAARASAAYRRLPIGWRLAGGSAALTGFILLGFAIIVGVLTTQRIQTEFNNRVSRGADDLAQKVQYSFDPVRSKLKRIGGPSLSDYAADEAVIRVVDGTGDAIEASSAKAPYLPGPAFGRNIPDYRGFRVETRPVLVRRASDGAPYTRLYVQYARRLSDTKATARRVQVLLGLGVLGGTALALLAGLATARRAMAPITELTEIARRIERTRDPTVQIPRPEADDEVAELANTLESMLGALDNARGETEVALTRQREFVADASHELRTPLTSVLANLELLEDVTEGEAREAVTSALRSSRRMRRLVADLLLLARADSGRVARHEPIDLSLVVAEAAGELEPVAGDHELQVDAVPGAVVDGARDELHRLVLNLLENALRHTDPGTAVEASVYQHDGEIVLAVEDDGPGIAPEQVDKVFERFFRGASDRGGSSGLGLSIVRAVAHSHAGTVRLEAPLDGRGARFVVRFPAAARAVKVQATAPGA
ncbi:MAG: HAMP domain-containing histidine kinase [Solirubrobacterales bacterium]|nr:HAMP domain-containing histidine kinase [Solirubrobacterales bacterium]